MYTLIRNILFRFDAEAVHHFSMRILHTLVSFGWTRKLIRQSFYPSNTKRITLGKLAFRNGVMLAAGFDKNAQYLDILDTLGFGAVEIGTVTPRPQAGNPQPRLFRLPADQALINRMGFNNEGVDAAVERLKTWRSKHPLTETNRMLIGGNIGKNKDTANESAADDYVRCYQALHPWVDFFTVNVSSPNTPGLRALQDRDQLLHLFEQLRATPEHQQAPKPIWLKIAPDLSEEQLHDVVQLAQSIQLDGIVATNTTIDRTGLHTSPANVEAIGAGGLSGLPLRERSTDVVQFLHQQLGGTVPIIASGGIFTASDAQAKRKAGAVLVQVWTGFIYRGPKIIREVAEIF